ncbi:MAG TPA: trypsin-like peptidase domain-containing protein [Verrucomicrobiae bacterium]|jgi:S1-C subfamily serine protease|nr:trypsin-like peptidase domain-containing protein [Verrucomicrobiae bacterium]
MEFRSLYGSRLGAFALSIFLLVPLLPALSADAQPATNGIENSVVKVFSTVRYPDPYQPWTKRSPSEITGSGVVISGKRILSNAHVVLYASQVQVQANQAGDKISATVEAVAPGIDLAVLKLDDDSFFDAHQPLPFSTNLPEIKDAVMAYGYPEGGTGLSITKGIVSRIEFAGYNAPVSGLRIQIDAPINPGNSGGPAVVGDHMIGLVFSQYGNAQNIGYIIPCEEINLFLQDIADGHYDGKPALRDDLQTLENPALRAFLQPGKSVEGMVVHKSGSDAPDYPLKQWDIITHIGDAPVDDQGMIKIGGDLRIAFTYLVQKIAKDGRVPLTIVRAGKELKVEVPVSSKYPMLIPDLEGDYPPYFIYGPLVFSTATKQFMSGLMESSEAARYMAWLVSRGSLLISRNSDKAAFKDEALVVVTSPFFPHKLSKGYSEPYAQVVKSVNGIPIRNLGHLVQVLRDATDKYVIIEFDGKIDEALVFPREEMAAATDEILTDNGIRAQGSADTLAIWNAKTAKK